MEQLGYHWTDFYETLYLSIFLRICQENPSLISIYGEIQVSLKSTEKIQVSLKPDRNTAYFT